MYINGVRTDVKASLFFKYDFDTVIIIERSL